MRRLALACLVVATACDDPSLHLDVTIPERYREQVVELSLDVILPPPGQPFACDDIAFREVGDDEVDAATLLAVNGAVGEALSFQDVPRLGDKLFRVRGLDEDGLAVVAACEAAGDLEGDVDIALVAEPTATAVLPNFTTGQPLPPSLTIGAIDANGQPIVGIDVRFTVTGPGVAPPTTGGAPTDAMGRAVIEPTAPALPGPVALDVRPRWVLMAPPSLFGYRPGTVVLEANLPSAGDAVFPASTEALYAVGRIGPAGELGIAALGQSDNPSTSGRQVYLAYYDPSQSPPFRTAVTAPIVNAFSLGVVDAGARDQLFTITGSSWVEILPTGATNTTASPRPGRAAVGMWPAGGCGGPPSSSEVLVQWSDDTMATYGPGGSAADSPFDDEPATSRLLASGCAVATDGDAYRVVVYGESTFQQIAIAEINPGEGSRTGLPTVPGGVGFAPAVGGAGPYLLGTEVTIEGTELTRYRLLPLGQRNLDLEMVTRDPTPTVAQSSVGGDFDADGELDVAALLYFGDSDRGTQFRLFQALEVDHDDGRLVGLSPPDEATRPQLWAVDFDGDGVDELVIGAADRVRVVRFTE